MNEAILAHDDLISSKIFALIAFARRPLRMKELSEAVGLLQSENSQLLKLDDIPFDRSLRQLFAPLIEVQEFCAGDDPTCRLFHSTVQHFLLRNPEILAQNLPITPRIIANACLGYLSQSRYAQLLTRSNTGWIATRHESVDEHHFLPYAAKYWDKHLDDVPGSEEMRKRVMTFITSSNFQTCIQVQSLWVDGKFAVFMLRGNVRRSVYLLRVFPLWFVRHAWDLWKDYRRFVHDWRHLLSCGNGWIPGEQVPSYIGEVDRCWWAALGSQNFLSRLHGRYTSFILQVDEDAQHVRRQGFEGVNATGDEFKILQLQYVNWFSRQHGLLTSVISSRDQGILKFTCEHWSLPNGNSTPTLEKTQIILVEEEATNWLLYTKYSGDESTLRMGRATPAEFSPDCKVLRIGAQLFSLDDQGTYVSIPGLGVNNDDYPAYVEEFVSRRPYSVLATRRIMTTKDIYQSGIRDEKIEGFGPDFNKMEETVMPIFEWSDDEDGGAGSESDSSYASLTDSEDRAYETWSECSTEHSEDLQFEDDTAPLGGSAVVEEGDLSDSSQVQTGENLLDDEKKGSGSDSEDSDLPASAILPYGKWYSDDEGSGDEIHYGRVDTQIETPKSRDLQVSLAVFDTSCSAPKRIFHFSRTVSSMLYVSPPVIHPSKALVVWPLGRGDVLFADFVTNTYFVRKLRPSTSHSECQQYASSACVLMTSSSAAYLHEMLLLSLRTIPTYRISRRTDRAHFKFSTECGAASSQNCSATLHISSLRS